MVMLIRRRDVADVFSADVAMGQPARDLTPKRVTVINYFSGCNYNAKFSYFQLLL